MKGGQYWPAFYIVSSLYKREFSLRFVPIGDGFIQYSVSKYFILQSNCFKMRHDFHVKVIYLKIYANLLQYIS